jgi:MYXO-CTERM domain-containing protein
VLTSLTQQLANHDGYLEALEEHVPLRAGVTSEEFASCPSCYFYPGSAPDLGFGGDSGAAYDEIIPDTDPIFTTGLGAFLAAVEQNVLAPIQATGALFASHDYLTRLYTTMSADEMTLDPIFQFNPDLEDVSNLHTADQRLSCEDDSWVVTLSNGQRVAGSARVWPHALDNTDLPFNVRILQYSTSGQPEVISDNEATIQSIHEDSPAAASAPVTFKKGQVRGGFCSVEQAPARGALWAWLAPAALGGVWLARRRRVSPVVVRKD